MLKMQQNKAHAPLPTKDFMMVPRMLLGDTWSKRSYILTVTNKIHKQNKTNTLTKRYKFIRCSNNIY